MRGAGRTASTLTAILAGLSGCAGPASGPSSGKGASDPAPVNSGLNALASDDGTGELKLVSRIDPKAGPLTAAEKKSLAQQAAVDFEAYLNRNPSAGLDHLHEYATPGDPLGTAEAAASPPPAGPVPEPISEPRAASDAVMAQADAAWEKVTAPKAGPAPKPSQIAARREEDPVVELASRMARLLREAPPGGEKISDAVALAAIEAVRPGVLADLEAPANALGAKLAPEDRTTLVQARDRVLRQPDKANESLVKSLAKIAPPAAFKVARAVLCRRVDGFGRYEPYGTDTFVAGRPLRVIVYTELDGFGVRPAREGDPVQPGLSPGEQVSVELSQSLTLYHDPSGLQAWHKPAQRVVETTRAKRRDFYLIHQIELPATLTVGRYMLKVTVTDATSGATDEVNLPINVVAQAPVVKGRN